MGSPRSQKTILRQLLDELVEGSPRFEARSKGLALYLVTCSPTLAQRIIDHSNIDNRKVRQNKVGEFARYMKRGDWMVKGTVEFLENGRLHDGQHRLLACADSGVEVQFLCHILPDATAAKANQFTDIGVPRNLSDYLHFQGVYEATRTAPFLVYERNFRISTASPFQRCDGERTEYLALYREIGPDKIKAAYDLVPGNLYRKMGVQRGFIDWFAYQTMLVDSEGAALFLAYVDKPEGCKRSDPMFVLHEKLQEMAAGKRQRKNIISLVEQATLIVKAWNLHYEHEPATTTKLRYRVSEEFPPIKGSAMRKAS